MKTLFKIGIALALFGTIGGCVYDPGYGYVRHDGYYGGSAYYGARYGYSPYDNEYSPGYYGYGYAYPSIGIGLNYYDRGYHRRGNWDGRGRNHGHRDNGGHRH